MKIDTTQLNKLNQANAATPGKIAAIYDWVSKCELFVYDIEEFDPKTQDLLITQIWTSEQEQLVQTKINYIKSLSPIPDTDVLELIRLYEMQIEWLSSGLDYAITTSD